MARGTKRYELLPIEGEHAQSTIQPDKPFTYGIIDMVNLDRPPIFRARTKKALEETWQNLNATVKA